MYRDAYIGNLLTIFFANGQKPLINWDLVTKDGSVSRYIHPDILTNVLELRSNNVSTTYMICPKGKKVLGIAMPFLVMVVKNVHKYFSFEVTILDETGVRRRFRVSNFQSKTQILPLSTAIPINLTDGWNQIQFNLAEFCSRAYGLRFAEVQKLKVNANIIIRRIYFAQKLLDDDELPKDYKLYLSIDKGRRKSLVNKSLIREEENAKIISPKVSSIKNETSGIGLKEEGVGFKGPSLEKLGPKSEGVWFKDPSLDKLGPKSEGVWFKDPSMEKVEPKEDVVWLKDPTLEKIVSLHHQPLETSRRRKSLVPTKADNCKCDDGHGEGEKHLNISDEHVSHSLSNETVLIYKDDYSRKHIELGESESSIMEPTECRCDIEEIK